MVKKITRDQLIEMIEATKMKLVDVLGGENFEQEHIPGSISLPLEEIEKRALTLFQKEDLIVVYCASFECQASTKAAEKLMAMGFKNVLDYKGGLKEYKEGGFPLEGTLHEGKSCYACGSIHRCDAC